MRKGIFGTLMACALQCFAATQEEAAWLALNYQNYLAQDKVWAFLSHNQVRLEDQSMPVRTALTENSIGYTLNEKQRLWLGYYYAYNEFPLTHFEENRLWQQFYWNIEKDTTRRIASRTRVEEIHFSNRDQNLYLLRQMFAYEAEKWYFGHMNPLIYDEVFFHLNNPEYATVSTLSQNRVFAGFNLYFSKDAFWKVGYINQYEMPTHTHPPAMTHILAVTYTFGAPEISLPVDS